MREICSTVLFTRDLKRIGKRHKNLNKLKEIIRLLASDTPLLPKHRPHKLLGNNFPKWECHIEPDWLLIYELKGDTVILYRTGSRADLF